MTRPKNRPHRVTLDLSEREMDMLREIAASTEVTVQHTLRTAIIEKFKKGDVPEKKGEEKSGE